MNIYDDLEKLRKLLDDGTISQEEFEREKARILSSNYSVQNSKWDLGIDEYSFAALMHASQFLTSFIIPLICWLLLRDKSEIIDNAGKEILNFEISFYVYIFALCLTCIGIPIALILGCLVMTIFIIIAVIKAFNKENWRYPLTFHLLK